MLRLSLALLCMIWLRAAQAAALCSGDCNDDGVVTIDELVLGVNIVLAAGPTDPCVALDVNGDQQISIDELVAAVAVALDGCVAALPTATATPAVSPTPSDGWRVLKPLVGARQECGVAALDGGIYVVGGFDTQIDIVPTVEIYDPSADAWRSAAPLPAPLHHVAVAAVGGKLYAVGGLRGYTFTAVDSLYVYDPAADAWQSGAALPQPRGAAAVAVIDGRIYAAGGLRGNASVDDFAVYDPHSDQWSEIEPMPTARDHHGAATVGGIFYAIGGRAGRLYDVVEAYDPTTRIWSTRAAMPTARGGLSVAALHGRIYAVGGEGNVDNPRGVFAQTEVYDPVENSWAVLPNMRTARHGTGAAGFGDSIFVPGGATRANFGPTAVNEALSIGD